MATKPPTTDILSIIWELSKFHTTLVNKWLLREFYEKGEPPAYSDLELVAKLSSVLKDFQNQAREISTADIKNRGVYKEVLWRLQGIPSVPFDIKQRARYLLRRINWPEGWPSERSCYPNPKMIKPGDIVEKLEDLQNRQLGFYQSIPFMPDYQSISLEELRLVDYGLDLKYGVPGDTEFIAYTEKIGQGHEKVRLPFGYFQNIYFRPPYKHLSPEELRLASYMLNQRYGLGPNFENFCLIKYFSSTIFFIPPYEKMSPEELRLADYAKGQKYGVEEETTTTTYREFTLGSI